MHDPIVILSAKRTPIGGLGGELSSLSAAEIGIIAAKSTAAASGVDAEAIDEVIFGNVLGAGQGQAPARQVALGAGLNEKAVATTVNKMCGSGMKAVMLAHDLLSAGSADVVLAGGTESMSNAPYLLPNVRSGLRMGHDVVQDHMFLDGLEDAYERGTLMGVYAERCASDHQFSRNEQDEYAIASLDRTIAAQANGIFGAELADVKVKTSKSSELISSDEQPRKARREKIPTLRPAFVRDGTVTAANSSSISDGAAALILTRASVAEANGYTPVARVIGHASHGTEPNKFPIAPIGAVEKYLGKTGTDLKSYDLFEVNEAFAVVALAAMKGLNLPHEITNVNGGACALGHPIGASGARIIVTLLHSLKYRSLQRGLAAICIGGGEATAIGLELME